ncbi:MAG: polyprenyl synthetase [Sulfobacillus acidophilus]|uniref:Farnesyl diphosphate synthase n=1 Tax=Sulfobacillus acidophilus TaxID=53633 RepID=A0A2T2WPI8_9FIRM|nr:MAG: polyprenyl synthetase [Sulfobacillus acidophilus]
MDLSRWMARARESIETWIVQDLEAMAAKPGSVEEAMRYSLLAGGKRLRPQLVLASGEYLGVEPQRLRLAALAVEYVHTYSLIHDDLPAMDNDDLRRGQPTSHKVFGEAMAILAGDALLTEAFVKMTGLLEAGFGPRAVVAATRALAIGVGREGLVRGQVQDLAAEHVDIGVQALAEIHRHKTAALFEACVTVPAYLVEDPEAVEVLSGFGQGFGLAFQMVDDILNVVGDPAKMGKAAGTDAGLGKATYPRLIGLGAARSLLAEQVQAAGRALDPERGELLHQLLQYSIERTW